MPVRRVEKKKALGRFFKNLFRFTSLQNGCLITFK